jgi:hypothetical protein
MFFDSLIDDAGWMARYARSVDGTPIPWELMEKGIRAKQPVAARTLRARLAVCFGERAIYEIPDDQLTAGRVLDELRAVERRITRLDEGSSRPILAVPHLLTGESSAYYHGYFLAKIAVHQTRQHFLARDGHLVDNPLIGPALRDAYWRSGNSRGFIPNVTEFTGVPLSAAALARHLSRTAEEALDDARARIARLKSVPRYRGEVDLDARIRVVHGAETVAVHDGADFGAFAADFERWMGQRSERAPHGPGAPARPA